MTGSNLPGLTDKLFRFDDQGSPVGEADGSHRLIEAGSLTRFTPLRPQ
ncbi:MAG TPA: hypothetical protein VEM15_08545 [Thermodesulfobacteriota bacterium]|nr:hypothetical protein [Thermodesulfobacteriota bacterium]